MNDEPLAYVILNSTKNLWLADENESHDGHEWSRSWYDAYEFDSLDEANDEFKKYDDHSSDTFYVLAIMPTA